MRLISSGLLLAALLGAPALGLSACARHHDEAPPAPPPADSYAEFPSLDGGPARSQADADAAARQAARDAWSPGYPAPRDAAHAEPYRLPPGLIMHRETRADGSTVLVISNRPIPNPAWRPSSHPRQVHRDASGGAWRPSQPARQAATTLAPSPATHPATVAPPATVPLTRPDAGAVAPQAPAPASPTAAAPTMPQVSLPPATPPAAPAKGFVVSPMLWLLGGLALLAVLVLSLLAGRKPKRRTTPHRHPDGLHA